MQSASEDKPTNILLQHPRILARTLHIGNTIYHNMLIDASSGRVEVSPFTHETAATVYINEPLILTYNDTTPLISEALLCKL